MIRRLVSLFVLVAVLGASPWAQRYIVSTTTSSATTATLANANTSDVVATSADTYLTGSALTIGPVQKAGTILRWTLGFTKTAAGTASWVCVVRYGTNGTTADTARYSYTHAGQTAATDHGTIVITAVVRSISATGTVATALSFTHLNSTSGASNQNETNSDNVVSSTFDNTSASLIAGVSCNPGASAVFTFQLVTAEATNLQ